MLGALRSARLAAALATLAVLVSCATPPRAPGPVVSRDEHLASGCTKVCHREYLKCVRNGGNSCDSDERFCNESCVNNDDGSSPPELPARDPDLPVESNSPTMLVSQGPEFETARRTPLPVIPPPTLRPRALDDIPDRCRGKNARIPENGYICATDGDACPGAPGKRGSGTTPCCAEECWSSDHSYQNMKNDPSLYLVCDPETAHCITQAALRRKQKKPDGNPDTSTGDADCRRYAGPITSTANALRCNGTTKSPSQLEAECNQFMKVLQPKGCVAVYRAYMACAAQATTCNPCQDRYALVRSCMSK